MRFIIDTNEFLFALGTLRKPHCVELLTRLISAPSAHTIHIPRTIFNEVRKNLRPIFFIEFIKLVNTAIQLDEDAQIPFELGDKYLSFGLKSADASIAAFAEYIGADALVSENRHFLANLASRSNIPFRILTAESCLKILGHK